MATAQSIQKQGEELKQAAKQGMKKAGDKLSKAIDDNVSDETKQQAAQIKDDVKNSLNQAQAQATQQIQSIKASVDANAGPWLQKQQRTATQYWADVMKQPNFAKGLLGALLFTNLICPLFFMNRAEGVVTFLTYLAVSAASHFLYQSAPANSPNRLFTSTFSHLLWVPLIFWLATRASRFDVVSSKAAMEHVDVTVALLLKKGFFLTNWIRFVLTVNAIALTLDGIKLAQILQQKGTLNTQALPKTSVDREQLIGEAEGSNVQREQQGVKQRMRSNVAAPTA